MYIGMHQEKIKVDTQTLYVNKIQRKWLSGDQGTDICQGEGTGFVEI